MEPTLNTRTNLSCITQTIITNIINNTKQSILRMYGA